MRTFAILAAVLFVACGPNDRDDGPGGGNGPDGGGGGGGGSGSNGNTEGCSDAAKLVYTVDSNNTLAKFDPTTKMFTNIGNLACPGVGSATPFSMGIDRDAVAWVLFSNYKIFRVDTSNANCTATTFSAPSNLQLFGMGFSANTQGSTEDTLFIVGGPDPGPFGTPAATSRLATLSTQSFTSTPVGTVTGGPELTGTGNAELWGWFPDETNPRVEQINKMTGAPIKTFDKNTAPTLTMLQGQGAAWAFAFWGGDFWVFLKKQTGLTTTEPNTKVYQVDGMTGALKSTTEATGRTIVGAGVSTCAPVVIL